MERPLDPRHPFISLIDVFILGITRNWFSDSVATVYCRDVLGMTFFAVVTLVDTLAISEFKSTWRMKPASCYRQDTRPIISHIGTYGGFAINGPLQVTVAPEATPDICSVCWLVIFALTLLVFPSGESLEDQQRSHWGVCPANSPLATFESSND